MKRRKNQELLEKETADQDFNNISFFLIHEFGLISMEKFVNTKGVIRSNKSKVNLTTRNHIFSSNPLSRKS
jgi:hypothetical protein